MLNIALIAGSSRSGSQSAKVARFLRQRLIELGLTGHEQSSLLDLGEHGLPLWPEPDVCSMTAMYVLATCVSSGDNTPLHCPFFHSFCKRAAWFAGLAPSRAGP